MVTHCEKGNERAMRFRASADFLLSHRKGLLLKAPNSLNFSLDP
jgi:hypothetical protein